MAGAKHLGPGEQENLTLRIRKVVKQAAVTGFMVKDQ